MATAAEQQRSDSPLSSSSQQSSYSKPPLSPENGPKDMFAPKVPMNKGPGPKTGGGPQWLKPPSETHETAVVHGECALTTIVYI